MASPVPRRYLLHRTLAPWRLPGISMAGSLLLAAYVYRSQVLYCEPVDIPELASRYMTALSAENPRRPAIHPDRVIDGQYRTGKNAKPDFTRRRKRP